MVKQSRVSCRSGRGINRIGRQKCGQITSQGQLQSKQRHKGCDGKWQEVTNNLVRYDNGGNSQLHRGLVGKDNQHNDKLSVV